MQHLHVDISHLKLNILKAKLLIPFSPNYYSKHFFLSWLMIIPNFQLLSLPNLESSSVSLCLELYVQSINKSRSFYHQNIFRIWSLSLTPLLTPLSHLPSHIIWIVAPAPNWTPCLCPCSPPVCSRGARMDFRPPFWPHLLLLYPENTLLTKMLVPCFPQSPPGTFFFTCIWDSLFHFSRSFLKYLLIRKGFSVFHIK